MPNMMTMNLLGHVGRDPARRDTNAPVEFSMAVNQKLKDEEKPIWFKITLWGKAGDSALKMVRKGDALFVSGRFTVEEWDDKQGVKQLTYRINVNEWHFVGGKKQEQAQQPSTSHTVSEEDGVPF